MDTPHSRSVEAPNYTQCPNVFYDEIMPAIDTMSELKVTEAIIRQTFGWHKSEDHVSLKQLEQMTGMNRQQVVAGCKSAIERGFVWREKRHGRNYFGLNVALGEDHPPAEAGGMTVIPQSGIEIIPTKESIKEKISNSDELDAHSEASAPVPLEKYIMDNIYRAMKDEGFVISTTDYSKQIKRVQWMIENMDPTPLEQEMLPGHYVKAYKIRGPACDAVYALNELRRQQAREKILAEVPKDKDPPRPKMPLYGTRSDGSWGIKE